MIIKNLSRHSGGSGGTIRYVLRYTNKKEKVSKNDESKEIKERTDEEALRKEYKVIFENLQIQYTEKDIDYLITEHYEQKLVQAYNNGEIPAGLQEFNKDLNKPFVYTHNIKSNTVDGYIREFEELESRRIYKRSNQPSVQHTILSFSKLDTPIITRDMLLFTIRNYISLRGEDCLFVASLHTDKEHLHLHIAQSSTRLNGRSSRISKKEFAEVKSQLQFYQQLRFPKTQSLPEHGKKEKGLNTERVTNYMRDERALIRNKILEVLRAKEYKNKEEALEALKKEGYTAYYRAGKLTGLQHIEGLKFRFSRLGIEENTLKLKQQEISKEEKALKEIREIRTKAKEKEIEQEKTNSKGREQ